MPQFPKTAPVVPFKWSPVPAVIFAGSFTAINRWYSGIQFHSDVDALLVLMFLGLIMVFSAGFTFCALYFEGRNMLIRVLAWCRRRAEKERDYERGE